MDPYVRQEIEDDTDRIEAILATDIFSPHNARHPLMRSAFIEILICLRDLMAKTNNLNLRIDFTDDVLISPDVKDVTDLIKFVRDALCHIDSKNHFVAPGIKATFNVAYGKTIMLTVDEFDIASDYDDDVCFFFGRHRIYLKRHIVRAFEEVKRKLLPFLKGI